MLYLEPAQIYKCLCITIIYFWKIINQDHTVNTVFSLWLFKVNYLILGGPPGGPVVKNPPAMQEMWARSLGGEDPMETEMATYSSILAWEIPRTEGPGGL